MPMDSVSKPDAASCGGHNVHISTALDSKLASLQRHNEPTATTPSDLDQRDPRLRVEPLLKATRTLGQNQFAGRTHVSLKEVATVGGTVATSHHHVRVHLRFSVL